MSYARNARRKIKRLRSWGFSTESIASAVVMTQPTLDSIRRGDTVKMYDPTYSEIMDLDYLEIFETVGNGMFVPLYPSLRRIQALNRMGWTHRALGSYNEAYGGSKWSIERLSRSEHSSSVFAGTHRRVERIFDTLCMTPGTNDRARVKAKNLGYVPPMWWNNPNNLREGQGRALQTT